MQEKFRHPSKKLKIFDNVLGPAQIKEGDASCTEVKRLPTLRSSIMLQTEIVK